MVERVKIPLRRSAQGRRIELVIKLALAGVLFGIAIAEYLSLNPTEPDASMPAQQLKFSDTAFHFPPQYGATDQGFCGKIKLENPGPLAMDLKIQIDGPESGAFRPCRPELTPDENPCLDAIAQGQSCIYGLGLTAATPPDGTQSARLIATSQQPGQTEIQVDFTMAPILGLKPARSLDRLTATANSDKTMASGAPIAVTVTNHAKMAVDPEFELINPDAAEISDDCGATIAAGGICHLNITPQSAIEGHLPIQINIAASFGEPAHVWRGQPLHGMVISSGLSTIAIDPQETPAITLSGTVQGQEVKDRTWQTIKLTNRSELPYVIFARSGPEIEHDANRSSDCGSNPIHVPGKGYCLWHYKLRASANGPVNGWIELSDSETGPARNRFTIPGNASGFDASGLARLRPGDTTLVTARNGWAARCDLWHGDQCLAPMLRPSDTVWWSPSACAGPGLRVFYPIGCRNCDRLGMAASTHLFCQIATGSGQGQAFRSGNPSEQSDVLLADSATAPVCAATQSPLPDLAGAFYAASIQPKSSGSPAQKLTIQCNGW